MSYKVYYNNKNVEIDKYCLTNSSMGGSGINGLWDTEEEVAYYAFFNTLYKMNVLSKSSPCMFLYKPNGEQFNDNELNSLIKKYFLEETKKIDKRINLCNNKFIKMMMNLNDWRLIKYWIVYEENLINNLNQEIKDKYEKMNRKSKAYINDFFEEEYIPALKLYKEPEPKNKQQKEDLEKIASRKKKI